MKKTFILLTVLASSLIVGKSFGQIVFQALEPAPVAGFYNFANPTWGANLLIGANSATGFGIIVDDGTAGDSLGCNPLVNSAAISGKVAFIYRGTCDFGSKALRAQNAGALAVVIINNIDGTIAMAPSTDGPSVTIPVVMIGKETGIILRPSLDAGTLKVFIGSKTGVYPNDLGIEKRDISRPLNYATPSLLAQDTSEFKMYPGAMVRNYGTQVQTNATVNAKILLNGTTQVYNESASTASISPLDSTFISLPEFHLPNGNVAKYTITYTISGDAAEDASVDNTLSQDFYITDNIYSKCRYDIAAGKPINTGGVKPAAPSPPQYTWGIVMNAVKGSRVKAESIQFSAATNAPVLLTDEVVTGYLYDWEDDGDGIITDEELVELAVGIYTYTSDLQSQVIEIPLSEDPADAPALADNRVYYVAVKYEGVKDFFFSSDNGIDYKETINSYNQVINPLFSSSWFGGGFGSNNILAIAVKTAVNNASVSENELNLNLSVYPNPASDNVNITFGNAVANSNIKVDVIDVTGRTVFNKQFNIGAAQNYVSVNTADLSNGTYFFKVSMNGQTVKSVPVVIAK